MTSGATIPKIPVIQAKTDDDNTLCPTCGMAVRIIRRKNGEADHYEANVFGEEVAQVLAPQDPKVARKLKKDRKGKKTVAIVGLAPTSCSLAPYEDEDVEIWCLNESHAFPQWLKRWDRWFQIHDSVSWHRQMAKRDVRDHSKWLAEKHRASNERLIRPPTRWDKVRRIFNREERKHYKAQEEEKLKPIYMQHWTPEVPGSVAYPLYEVRKRVFKNFWRGDYDDTKYFTSTFAYMAGIAELEDFERVEIYGFEMSDEIEYITQKACAEFWIGYLMGKGVEIYVPDQCQLLWSWLYGGAEQGKGW
jgi:hypothetical protein